MSDMEKEFDDWFSAEVDGGSIAESIAWRAWQASRQALVVQLPLWRHNQGEQVYSINEVKQALADAGVGFKS